MANSFNYYCSHQNFCHPFCYKRHMRSASRLIKAVRQVNTIFIKKPMTMSMKCVLFHLFLTSLYKTKANI